MLPHNKIIKTTVKEFLEPENLFQIGSSRSWVDDNGYYFIIVEFATNGYSKGASLNAGVSFLWESTESLNKMLSYNYGCDVSTGVGYVEYKNDDEAFQIVIEKLAKSALKEIDEYRKFSDMEYAKKQIKLSVARSNLKYFTYRIKKNSDLIYNDILGELRCIYDGEQYFENTEET